MNQEVIVGSVEEGRPIGVTKNEADFFLAKALYGARLKLEAYVPKAELEKLREDCDTRLAEKGARIAELEGQQEKREASFEKLIEQLREIAEHKGQDSYLSFNGATTRLMNVIRGLRDGSRRATARIAELEAQLGKAEREKLEAEKAKASLQAILESDFRPGDTVESLTSLLEVRKGKTYKVTDVEYDAHLKRVFVRVDASHLPWDPKHFKRASSAATADFKGSVTVEIREGTNVVKSFEPLQFVTHTPTGRRVRIDEIHEGTAIVSEPFGGPYMTAGERCRKTRVRLVDLAPLPSAPGYPSAA